MATYEDVITEVEDLAVTMGDALQLRGFKTGGTAGQVPVKTDGTDFNWSWGTINTTITTSSATTITGLLKGDGSVVSAAVAGTDYAGLSSSNTWSGSQTWSGDSFSFSYPASFLTALGAGSAGANVLAVDHVTAASFLRFNDDDSVTLRSASETRTDLGLGTGDSPTFAGLTTSGTVTATGGMVYGDSATFTYGTGAADVHRTALGLGVSDSVTFGYVKSDNYGDSNGLSFRTSYGIMRVIGGGTNSIYLGGTDDCILKRSAAGVLRLDTYLGAQQCSLLAKDLTASGTVTAAKLNQGTSSTADPSTTEFPNDMDWGVHKNTSSGNVFLAYNDGGTIKKVQLT